MNQDDIIELDADVKVQAVKELGAVSLDIVNLGVAATVFFLMIIAVLIVFVVSTRSNTKRDERNEQRWIEIHGQMIQVVKENTSAQMQTAEAVRDNADATKAVKDLIHNMELKRLQDERSALLQQQSQRDAQ